MATRSRRTLMIAVFVLGSGALTLTAADVDQALREADGRRKAAESGVHGHQGQVSGPGRASARTLRRGRVTQQRLAGLGLPSHSTGLVERAGRVRNG